MKIYTSYYAKLKHLREANIVPVSVSIRSPWWYKEKIELKQLAPDEQTLALGKSDNTFAYYERFKAKLEKLNKVDVLLEIKKISKLNDNKDVALCCYEKVTDFCHRHIVADWLNEYLEKDKQIVEFSFDDKKYIEIVKIQKSYWNKAKEETIFDFL